MRALGAIGKGMFMVDHSPIILDFGKGGHTGRGERGGGGGMHLGKDFRFQTMCRQAEGFLDRVQQWCSY